MSMRFKDYLQEQRDRKFDSYKSTDAQEKVNEQDSADSPKDEQGE